MQGSQKIIAYDALNDILNPVRELSRFMTMATPGHLKAMYRVMVYCVRTENRGILLMPNRTWNEDPNFEFEIVGKSDSNYATDPITRRSVSGCSTFLNDAPVIIRSKQQGTVKLSMSGVELDSGTMNAQYMLFAMHVFGIPLLEGEETNDFIH